MADVRVRIPQELHSRVLAHARKRGQPSSSIYAALVTSALELAGDSGLAVTGDSGIEIDLARAPKRRVNTRISDDVRSALTTLRQAGAEPLQIASAQIRDIRPSNGHAATLWLHGTRRARVLQLEITGEIKTAVETLVKNARSREQLDNLCVSDLLLVDDAGKGWPARRIGYVAKTR